MVNEQEQAKKPRVFVTYSWTSPEHEGWVKDLATRLSVDGVKVILDKWDLKEGQDIFDFMETMVRADETDKVLVICDKGYKEKAEQRRGGVGTETQIISPEVYGNVKQEKFVPIVAERDEQGKHFIPTFMVSRKYIDLSFEESYEQGYEALLRNIFGRPEHRKPATGTPPSWLFEDEPSHIKTTTLNKQMRDAVHKNPNRVGQLAKEFVDEFLAYMEEYQIERTNGDIDEQIVNKINDMIVLRDDFIDFVEQQCSFHRPDVDMLIEFFEQVVKFSHPPEHVTSYSRIQFDHYKFFIQELFIYTIAVLLRNSCYAEAGSLLRTHYFIKKRFENNLKNYTFSVFNFYTPALDEVRNQRLNQNRVSVTADLLVQRATLRKYPKNKMVETDLLLHYISVIEGDESPWFPRLYIYGDEFKLEFLQRLMSKRYFERVKEFFDVFTEKQLKDKLATYQSPFRGYERTFGSIPELKYHINIEEICKLP